MPHCLLVTGTGTDIGKTHITAALLRSLLLQGTKAKAIKLVQTGVLPDAVYTSPKADAYHYLQASQDLAEDTADCFFSYPLASSPHLAAKEHKTHLTIAMLKERIQAAVATSPCDVLLFETAGGLCVPINEDEDMLDLITELGFPILLVAQNCLGTINHTLLSLDAIKARGLSLCALILNQATPENNATICEDNALFLAKRLAHYAKDAFFCSVPYEDKDPKARFHALAHTLQALAAHCVRQQAPHEPSVASLIASDRAHIWHPYTKAKNTDPLYVVSKTEKNHIHLQDGRVLIDGMSSWWTSIHGYNHPRILAALRKQAEKFPHVMFGGLTHAPAISLANRLLSHLPKHFGRVFFSDSGSVANEVAMKMAIQYHYERGEKKRTRFVTPLGGYFGDTLGVMSICNPGETIHPVFTETVIHQHFIPRPQARFDQAFDPKSLDPAKDFFAKHGHELIAVILEPIVQGAGGMWFYHPNYLTGIADLCKDYGCLLLFDEIATGFGHTGKFFAMEWANLCPDIVTIGKALTGGTITLAATICTDAVAETLSQNRVLTHGPTFMANPMACAVANASLDIMEEGLWQEQVHSIEAIMTQELKPCLNLDSVQDVRVLGDIGVVQTKKPVNQAFLTRFFTDHGVWIRPFNDLVYIMPPYVSPAKDVAHLCRTIVEALAACPMS